MGSYGREFIEDNVWEIEEYNQIIEDINEGIWTTKNMSKISIKNMSSSHIINCLKLFNEHSRKGKALRHYLKSLKLKK